MESLELNPIIDLKREGKSFYWASFFLPKKTKKMQEYSIQYVDILMILPIKIVKINPIILEIQLKKSKIIKIIK